ncbi:hypothetical protein MF1_07440 [Bartonella quintana]|uniref:hypothetical protein n=1 Tax=Bartonella quintana TaxID=803 RepID=UPI00031F4779|nr:hypothetical protein [Bartonella quintana]BBL53486.1 hypothetical protein MF1_07440 [Bartonella quintana]
MEKVLKGIGGSVKKIKGTQSGGISILHKSIELDMYLKSTKKHHTEQTSDFVTAYEVQSSSVWLSLRQISQFEIRE